ncbi:MAG TPA: bifunctional glutamate N-acetyltransferase/amino-acid acetyltransferase ArgJ [Candidatus Lokiarchaeia archaeon]|nr:bifunctional glutamate N-acetyltransferase/amino-acid acetyltransferase ArgJ [Candidatus Lokiarchaeia archaeon]
MMEKLPDPAITAVQGIRAFGLHCGIKPDPTLMDLALISSDTPASAAAVFTTNQFKAAPVLYDQEILSLHASEIRAILINSGCANACTGELGMKNARREAEAVASAINVPADSVLVMSTGVIGVQLPLEKIEAGIAEAAPQLSLEGGHLAARAIMTTDTVPKEVAVAVDLPNGSRITIAGIAKGAGMIHPNMATLLVCIATDASVDPVLLQDIVREAADVSFNCITVDGDTSTNDTLLLLANGGAGSPEIIKDDPDTCAEFTQAVCKVARTLAHKIIKDGEGASKFITIHVKGAQTNEDAKRAAKSIANSALVKTAFFGEDPNWGRILCAVGYSGIEVDPMQTDLFFIGADGKTLQLVAQGQPLDYDESEAHEMLTGRKVGVIVDLHLGNGKAKVWSSDLSFKYVEINAHYRT